MRFLPLLLFFLAACAGERAFNVRGQVVGFGDDSVTVFVAHEAIPRFMPAMTMPFTASAPLPSLDYGDPVAFVLHVTRDASWISDVVRLPDTTTLALAEAGARLPANPTPTDAVLDPGASVPAASLVGDDGAPFTLADYRGQVLVLDFIYTRCPLPDYCPLLSRRMAAVQQHFPNRENVRLLSITLDPDYDTPEVLHAYRERYTDTPATWRFATGSPAQMQAVYGLFGQYVLGEGAVLQHNLVAVVVGTDGRVRRYFRGQDWSEADVIEAVEAAL